MEPAEQKKQIKRIAIIGALFILAAILYHFRLRNLLTAYVITVPMLMVVAILFQSGRGGGLASIGGVGGDSFFGTRSATPIAKATYVLGALFLFICMLLSRLGSVAEPGVTKVIGPPVAPPAAEQPINVDVPGETKGPRDRDAGGPAAPAEEGSEQGKEAPAAQP